MDLFIYDDMPRLFTFRLKKKKNLQDDGRIRCYNASSESYFQVKNETKTWKKF